MDESTHKRFTPVSQRLGGKRHERHNRKIGRVGWDDWIRTVEVEPSLYAADFSKLGHDVDVLLRAGARIVHFAVMVYFVLFLVPHVVLVLVDGWDTLRSMIVGWSSRIGEPHD